MGTVSSFQPRSITSKMAAVYVNGNVYTVDPSIAKAEAFHVKEDGTFGKVGSTAELTQLAHDTGAKVVDLKGQFVMPGMHDAHIHILAAAEKHLFNVKLGLNAGPDEIVSKLKDYKSSCQHLESVDGAKAVGRDKTEGTITPGKLANFIILDRDLSEAKEIGTTIVLKTFFEGKEVYDYESDDLKH